MPIYNVNGTSLFVSGRIITFGEIKDEYWLETGSIGDPERMIEAIKDNRANIDIFEFSQKLPETLPKYNYFMKWDNVAALEVSTFDFWWSKQINDKTRNMVRKANKKGVDVRISEFDDSFIEGIADIYNETPIRQGRPFLHYGKDTNTVRIENSSFLDRSTFLGAYYDDELIGFVKLVRIDKVVGMMQILSKIKDRDKATNNALLAKAVEFCAETGANYLTYAKFVYGNKGIDPVAEFKHHNGFKKIDIPKYYVPLTVKGNIGLKLGLYRDIKDILPRSFLSWLINIRKQWHKKSTN